MKYLSLFLFALLLAACDSSESTSESTTDGMEAGDTDTMEADNPTALLQSTQEAVQANGGDITALPADAAVSNIDNWMDQLDGMDGTDAVTGNLEALKATLTESPINGQLAGMQLISLAEDTRKAGGSTVSALASALQSGGEKLTGSSFQGSSLLDQTLSAAKGKAADITTLPVSAATQNIDGWIAELRGMDGADGLVEDLESLKTELGAPSIDGEKVSDLLFEMAESTRSMAGDNQGLAVLAYLLESGGWRLEGMSDDMK
ncbi:hypothetical protein [Lewinella sp. IMCC34183]|uniref:hypothetical protein n=1 Tax=Lewinella sp. IMCC34183 TaxID=2248762 RepID=UPI000E27145A|nr:hypothetical protein [Lewinella sp. IMCC34183]